VEPEKDDGEVTEMSTDNFRWYNISLVASISTLILAQIFSIYMSGRERELQRNERSKSLRVAFAGEVTVMKGELTQPTRDVMKSWDGHSIPIRLFLYYPHKIYDSNTAHIGDIFEYQIVMQLVNVYSWAERTRELAAEIAAGHTEKEVIQEYSRRIVSLYIAVMTLEWRLRSDTRDFVENKTIPRGEIPPEDLEDYNKAVNFFDQYVKKSL
jgi:hypothetical protein